MPREKPVTPKPARQLAWRKSEEPPQAEGANFFHFAWSGGTDVQLTVGFIDLNEIAAQQKPEPIDIEVTHRFFLSVRGFALLRAQMEAASEALTAQGVPINEMTAGFRATTK